MRTKLGMAVSAAVLLAVGLGATAGATVLAPSAPIVVRPATDARLLSAEASSLAAAESRLAAVPGTQHALSGIKSQLDTLKGHLDAAVTADPTDPPGVTVIGTGQVLDTPDVMTLSIGVSSQQATPALALAAANAGTQRIIDALHGQGVGDQDIQTQFVSFGRSWSNQAQWQAGNQLTVKLRD